MSALVPFLACAQWGLQFHCRVVLCSVVKAGGDVDVGLTKLSEKEMETLFQLLETVAHSANQSVSIEKFYFTASELLSCVNLLLVNDDNVSAFRNNTTILSTFVHFLTFATDTVEITLQVLWKLLLGLSGQQNILGGHQSTIVDRLTELAEACDDSMVHVLSECVLYILNSNTAIGMYMIIMHMTQS